MAENSALCGSWPRWGATAGAVGVAAGLILKLVTALKYRSCLAFLGDPNIRKLLICFIAALVCVTTATLGHYVTGLYQTAVGCHLSHVVDTPTIDQILDYMASSGGAMMGQAYVVRNHRDYQVFVAHKMTIRFGLFVGMVISSLAIAFWSYVEKDELIISIIYTCISLFIFISVVFLSTMTETAKEMVNDAVNVAEVADRKAEIEINDRLHRLIWAPCFSFVFLSTVRFALAAKADMLFPEMGFSYYDIYLASALIFLSRLCFLSHLRHPRFRHLARVAYVNPSNLPAGMGACVVDKQVQTEVQMTEGLANTVETEEVTELLPLPAVTTSPLMSLAGRSHHTLLACLLENSWIMKKRVQEGITEQRRRWEASLRVDYARIDQEARFYRMYMDCRAAALQATASYNARAGEFVVCV
ncbi:hypothetical protein PRIPAC_97525 [Pristionchus pacificus]|uniref:Uncharacterized protein n=1 Tax=Pristionchus pacificus TaxID=54126 RepID=A0A2A6CGQ6_PRIPA|nr:hypothetical protein PRIPAC_97525 [Pristionchus pacificus]|eukprot:PDM77405.1 hypothetical protein PRIPAC_33135 [Pristionchus pacificus]